MNKLQEKRISLIRKLKPVKNDFNITDVIEGSYIEYNKEIFYVEEIATYTEVKWKTFDKKKEDYIVTELKLFSLKTGKTVYIEYEIDDEIEVYLTLENISLKDIKYNNKIINNKILIHISEDEFGDITYNNIDYKYIEDDTLAALYNSKKYKNEKVRLFEFVNNNKYLTIEMWNSDDKPEKEAFISKKIDINKLKVLKKD